MTRWASVALSMVLVAVGFSSVACGAEPGLDSCERFAEYFIHTNGHIDEGSRRQCNAGPQAECEDVRHNLQKNIAGDDDKLNRQFVALLPCGEAPQVNRPNAK